MSHLPFRSWCRHCVRGRGAEMGHLKSEEKPAGGEIHVDLRFPGKGDGSGGLTVLATRERATRMTMAAAIPAKSGQLHREEGRCLRARNSARAGRHHD